MDKTQPQTATPVLSIICSAFGHDYIITRKITDHINEYKCACCGKEVTNSFSGKYELLTYKQKEVNSCLSNFFDKKKHYKLKSAR